jgi:hypothetical protein
MADDGVTLGEVNRNVQNMAGDVRELSTYLRVQNGRVSKLETQVAVLEATKPDTPKRGTYVLTAGGGLGLGAALMEVKKMLGW